MGSDGLPAQGHHPLCQISQWGYGEVCPAEEKQDCWILTGAASFCPWRFSKKIFKLMKFQLFQKFGLLSVLNIWALGTSLTNRLCYIVLMILVKKIWSLLCFRLLLRLLAFTAFGQRPPPLLLAPPITPVNISICMTSRSLLTTPSYPAWTYTYAMTALQWMKVSWPTHPTCCLVLCLKCVSAVLLLWSEQLLRYSELNLKHSCCQTC